MLLVLVVYQPSLDNGFILDDDMYVEENPTLRTLTGLRDIWFKFGRAAVLPAGAQHVLDRVSPVGLWPAGYHAVNLSLHATSVLLLWRLLRGSPCRAVGWPRRCLPHPVAVESVAWVTERENVLRGALALAALLTYLRFLAAGAANRCEDCGDGLANEVGVLRAGSRCIWARDSAKR